MKNFRTYTPTLLLFVFMINKESMSSTKRRLSLPATIRRSAPAVLYTARSIRSSPNGKTYGQLLLEEQVQQMARQKEQEALWALRVEHSAKQEKEWALRKEQEKKWALRKQEK